MNQNEENFFTILNQKTETGFTIQRNVPEAAKEQIEVKQIQQGKTQDDKPVLVLTTDIGRKFARLEEWPDGLLMEIK